MKIRQDTFSTGSEQQKAYWFAFYTKSKMERRIQNNLQLRNIECYTPVIKELRQWSDRMKWIEEPLFRNYVLAKVPVNRIYEILSTDGCVYVVSFEGEGAELVFRWGGGGRRWLGRLTQAIPGIAAIHLDGGGLGVVTGWLGDGDGGLAVG